MRLLALPPLPQELLQSLFGDPRLEIVLPAARTQQHVDALLPDVDLVLGDWTPQLRVGDPGPRVAFVQQPSAGVDGIDTDACAARLVPVSNCAGANAISVAEWCLSATFALLRKTVEADRAVRRGDWPQTSLGGRELRGLKVGIVGMGAIGRAAAELYRAVGCDVVYWSRNLHPDAPAEPATLQQIATSCDVVVLVIALGEQTRGLVDADFLAAMKQGAMLVNGARGEVVDEAALAAELERGRLTAALDVFSTEPLPEDAAVRRSPGVLLSPHMAGSTVEAAMRIVGQAKANLVRVLDGQPVLDVVNDQNPLVRKRA
ncbi:MAG: 3-phosphoglycerate dehydrogenase [Frankiales bacterium]|nr:3-phosphoglycerate dehydrogenase [Frankiales bacterium]